MSAAGRAETSRDGNFTSLYKSLPVGDMKEANVSDQLYTFLWIGGVSAF